MTQFISIIVPTYKRNPALATCLLCLNEAVKLTDITIEIIVTDDFNATETKAYLSKHNFAFQLIVVDGPKKGPAANRNNGARIAKGEWLIFTDDDCLPDKNIVSNYILAICQNPSLKVFEGKIISDREKNRYDEEAPINTSGNNFWSCNICVKKDAFLKVGEFDENFPYPTMEDIDLFMRLKADKYDIRFVENAYVIHPWRVKKNWNGYFNRIGSVIYFYKKHYKAIKPSRFLYFKILIAGLPERFKTLFKMRFKGIKYFCYENAFYFILAFSFYTNIKKDTPQ